MGSGLFAITTFSGVALVVLAAAVFRNRFFALFMGVLLSIEGIIAVGIYDAFEPIWPIFLYLQVCVHLHFISLSRARMRPPWWRLIVSVPGLFFAAGALLSLPFAVVAAFGAYPWGVQLPFVLAAFGVWQSFTAKPEEIDLVLDGRDIDGPVRHPYGDPEADAPLRIVQITDPHLGPLMSVARLRGICERAVAWDPDLILLTGDFLTMESQTDPQVLADSLAPLAVFEGKVFACHGNHDLEAPHVVRQACDAHGIRLLIDEEATLETAAGPVQIVGADFSFRKRRERLEQLTEECPRREGHLRIVMLHDPGAFKHLPEGSGDLVLGGHTHGGQVGLLSLGIAWTFVSGFTSIPDQGFWARGKDRLYVHRGTGVYGFPLRVGVPGEESLLRIHVTPRDQ